MWRFDGCRWLLGGNAIEWEHQEVGLVVGSGGEWRREKLMVGCLSSLRKMVVAFLSRDSGELEFCCWYLGMSHTSHLHLLT